MKRWMAVLAATMLSACGEGEITEAGRFPSPTGELDAVIGTIQAGENHPYLVVITKSGEKPVKGIRVMMADKITDAPRVEWQDAHHMTIRCDGDARIWSYRNFWSSPSNNATLAVGLECGTKGWR